MLPTRQVASKLAEIFFRCTWIFGCVTRFDVEHRQVVFDVVYGSPALQACDSGQTLHSFSLHWHSGAHYDTTGGFDMVAAPLYCACARVALTLAEVLRRPTIQAGPRSGTFVRFREHSKYPLLDISASSHPGHVPLVTRFPTPRTVGVHPRRAVFSAL